MSEKDLTINVLGKDVSGSKTLKDVGKAADDAGDKLEGASKIGVKALAGLAAAAPVAGVAVAGGLAIAGGAFAGLAVLTLASNDKVRESFSDLSDHVKSRAQEMAAPLEKNVVNAAKTLQNTFDSLDLEEGFKAAAPAIDHTVAGIDQLARRAIPAMIRATKDSEPAFIGMRGFLGDLGDGLGEFFDEIRGGAPTAGRVFDEFGDIVRDTLGLTGGLLADLSNNGVGTVTRLTGVFGQLTDITGDLGAGAMPALFGTASSVLGVLEGILDVAGPLAPILGVAVGTMLSAKAGVAIFGAAGDVVGRWGDRAVVAGEKGGKLRGAVGSLGSTLSMLGPYGAVAGGALLGVSAAADAAFGSVDQLTASLQAGGNAAAKATEQLKSNDEAFKFLTEEIGVDRGILDLFITTTQEASEAVTDQRSKLTTLQRAQQDAAKAAADHSFAVEKYGAESDKAAATSAILTKRQADLKTAQDDAARATKTLTERLIEQQMAALGLANDNLALRMAQFAYEDSVKATSEAINTYGKKSKEARDAMLAQESAALRLIQAAGVEAAAHYDNRDSIEATEAAYNATNAKALELAANMTGPLPAALATMILNMDNASLSALGATRSIDGTGTAIITLPNGKVVKIEANDQATSKIQGIQREVDAMRGKTIDIWIRQLVSTSPNEKPANLFDPTQVLGKNAGGIVPGTGANVDSVPAMLTPKEFVVNREATAQHLPFLQAINRGAGGDAVLEAANRAYGAMGGGGGGGGGGIAGVRVSLDFGSGAGLTGLERIFWEWLKESARGRGEVFV
ncbi:hypothetical protein [Lentzea sp. NBRC 102530]|uniref:hypothetical protein n=1 Tax=Lentzea sp. NBRC 102530 TaxID=3032201 RepID=UPI0024A47150|nr:hypothetical protein [Lentzea sp. NBRC 102530]GLY55174.1 hypothetical protein Lesp01_88290 [Lentzea sp. NBRC 102530]